MIGRTALLLAAVVSVAACNKASTGNDAMGSNASSTAARPEASKGKLADALGKPENARFAAALKAAGMDQVLAGPGPYTVLVPSDAALGQAGNVTGNKEALVKLISGHILPGTILVADIGMAIDAHGGKAQLKSMAGGTLTATRADGQLQLAGSGGAKGTLTGSEEVYSNGVIHHVDALLARQKG